MPVVTSSCASWSVTYALYCFPSVRKATEADPVADGQQDEPEVANPIGPREGQDSAAICVRQEPREEEETPNDSDEKPRLLTDRAVARSKWLQIKPPCQRHGGAEHRKGHDAGPRRMGEEPPHVVEAPAGEHHDQDAHHLQDEADRWSRRHGDTMCLLRDAPRRHDTRPIGWRASSVRSRDGGGAGAPPRARRAPWCSTPPVT
jgi:hypothetical protein